MFCWETIATMPSAKSDRVSPTVPSWRKNTGIWAYHTVCILGACRGGDKSCAPAPWIFGKIWKIENIPIIIIKNIRNLYVNTETHKYREIPKNILKRPNWNLHASFMAKCPSISNCEPVDRFLKKFGKMCCWRLSHKLSFEFKKIGNSNMADARSCEVGRNQRCFIQGV